MKPPTTPSPEAPSDLRSGEPELALDETGIGQGSDVRPAVVNRMVRIGAGLIIVLLAVVGGQLFGDPVAIGAENGDGWTYLAAGERLNAGRPLYVLQSGDRPVQLAPPFWTIPLLSPPPIAVVWRGLAPLGDTALWIWAIGGLAAASALLGWVLVRGSMVAVVGAAAVGPILLLTATAGNANAYLAPLLAMSWLARRRPWLPAAAVVVASFVKLTPVALGTWLLRGGRLVFAVGIAISILAVSWVFAPGSWMAWLTHIGESAPSPYSIAGRLGISAPLVTIVVLAISAALARMMRHSERAEFAIGLFAAVAASPAIYWESYAMLAPLLVLSPLRVEQTTEADSDRD